MFAGITASRGAIVISLFLSVAACGQQYLAGGQGKSARYTDPLYGYSLVPPDEVQQRRGNAVGMLMSWSKIDPSSPVASWTLGIQHRVETNKDISLDAFSKALSLRLRLGEKLKAAPAKLTTVSGKSAIDLVGTTIGTGAWQRQVWVLVRPQEFLVMKMTGSASEASRLSAICDKVLASMQFSDPAVARSRRARDLKEGVKLLGSLDMAKLLAAMKLEPRWYLLQMDGKYVGFRRVIEGPGQRKGAQGFEVKVWQKLQAIGKLPRLEKKVMFATPDGKVAWFWHRVQTGARPHVRVVTTETLKQDQAIVGSTMEGGQARTFNTIVPAGSYMPRAIVQLLPRLVARDEPSSQAFISHNPDWNCLEMRTFSIIGPGREKSLGQGVIAIRATDQPARDVEATELWLDENGKVLRCVEQGQLTVIPAAEKLVKAFFPKAEQLLKAMGD